MKQCSRCKKLLSERDFYKDKRTKNGLYSACKKCHYSFKKNINIIKRREYQKRWKAKNPEKIKEYYKSYLKKYQPIYQKKRRESDPEFRLDCALASNIAYSLRGKKAGRKWESLVGYALEDLIIHLEKQFDDKMNWGNYGNYWEVDHIKPKSLFKYETAEDAEFKRCWALENLQPMEKIANRIKHNSIKEP